MYFGLRIYQFACLSMEWNVYTENMKTALGRIKHNSACSNLQTVRTERWGYYKLHIQMHYIYNFHSHESKVLVLIPFNTFGDVLYYQYGHFYESKRILFRLCLSELGMIRGTLLRGWCRGDARSPWVAAGNVIKSGGAMEPSGVRVLLTHFAANVTRSLIQTPIAMASNTRDVVPVKCSDNTPAIQGLAAPIFFRFKV